MKTDRNQILTWAMIIVVVTLLLAVAFISVTAQERVDPYTEFYILNSEGSASEYPTNTSTGETSTLTVGISNQERTMMIYTLVVTLENETIATRTVQISNNETWEESVSFTPESARQIELRLLLYRGENSNLSGDAYRSLRLWINAS